MSTNTKSNKLSLVSTCTALVQGVNTLTDTTFTLDGQTVSKAAVLAPLNACIAAITATTTAHSNWTASVQAERTAVAAAVAMIAVLKPYLKVRLGKSNPVLKSEFGVAPAKAAKKPVAVKSAAIAKAKATRAARHTMGTKQRAGIKGAVATPPAPKAPTS
jgi:hypothetical protein